VSGDDFGLTFQQAVLMIFDLGTRSAIVAQQAGFSLR
jgi:hypothetical protein